MSQQLLRRFLLQSLLEHLPLLHEALLQLRQLLLVCWIRVSELSSFLCSAASVRVKAS